MAIYKIFPKKDTSIYSQYPYDNFGRDEILEIKSYNSYNSRILIEFDNTQLNNFISNIDNNFQSNIKLYLSEASNIKDNYSIEIYPLSSSWEMGTGRNQDFPNPQNGASWEYPNSYDTNVSWSSNVYSNSNNTQSFDYYDSKDINCDITSIVQEWYSSSINNGLLIKFPNELEYPSSSLDIKTSFFSIDTHTVYPPHIEFKWSDVDYTSSLPIIDDTQFVSNIVNNKKSYKEQEVAKFVINNRELFPPRSFQTSSVYLNNKILPEESYWALKDYKTNEIIIDYDELGTKIGANDEGNYFNIYMNGLQPERYYQILLKTKINNEVIIVENPSNIFKIYK